MIVEVFIELSILLEVVHHTLHKDRIVFGSFGEVFIQSHIRGTAERIFFLADHEIEEGIGLGRLHDRGKYGPLEIGGVSQQVEIETLVLDDLIHRLLIPFVIHVGDDGRIEVGRMKAGTAAGFDRIMTVFYQQVAVILGFDLIVRRTFFFLLMIDIAVTVGVQREMGEEAEQIGEGGIFIGGREIVLLEFFQVFSHGYVMHPVSESVDVITFETFVIKKHIRSVDSEIVEFPVLAHYFLQSFGHGLQDRIPESPVSVGSRHIIYTPSLSNIIIKLSGLDENIY